LQRQIHGGEVYSCAALLLCDAGKFGDPWKVADVASALDVSSRAIERIKRRFVE
jgi:hypothetical protein